MPQGVTVQGPDGNTYQFPDGTTKESAISFFKKKGIGAAPSKEMEPPDTSGEIKKRRELTVGRVSPVPLPGETAGGIITSPSRMEQAVATAKGPGEELRKDIRTGALALGGGSIGAGLGETLGLVKGAEEVAGGSKLLKFLLPALTRGASAGTGAAAGTLAAGGTPKEALGTAATFTGAEVGMEGLGKVFKPVGKFVKDLTKSKVTQLEEQHAAEVAAKKAAYEEEVQAHKQKMMQVQQHHEQQLVESQAQHQRDVESYQQGLRQAEQAHKQELEQAETAHKENVEAHKRQIQATAQMEEQKAAQAEAEYQKQLTAHKEKVATINKEYQTKVDKFKTAESLKSEQAKLGATVSENVKMADKTIQKRIGDEFQKVNEAVERKGPTAQPTDATKSARSEIIFPDSLNAFNNIIKNLGKNVKGGEFSNMRASYTKLNELLYGGSELPPDLYKAVKIVRDSLGKDLQKAASSVGMGERYSAAMGKWAKYMDDWHDTSSLAKGGSPISRLLTAEDPAFVIDQFGGKASDRLVKTLAEYKDYGVNTELAKNLKDSTSRLKSMAAVPKELPGQPKLPAEPTRKPEPTFTKIPTPPVAPTGPSSVAIPRAPVKPTPQISVGIPTPPQAPNIQPFDREAAARQVLLDRIRKILLAGGTGAAAAYGMEKLFGGKNTPLVP